MIIRWLVKVTGKAECNKKARPLNRERKKYFKNNNKQTDNETSVYAVGITLESNEINYEIEIWSVILRDTIYNRRNPR